MIAVQCAPQGQADSGQHPEAVWDPSQLSRPEHPPHQLRKVRHDRCGGVMEEVTFNFKQADGPEAQSVTVEAVHAN